LKDDTYFGNDTNESKNADCACSCYHG
jgi:hypothetical protein